MGCLLAVVAAVQSLAALRFATVAKSGQLAIISDQAKTASPEALAGNGTCQDAVLGGKCFRYVTWAMMHGVYIHPKWYEGLYSNSSFKEFQQVLHAKGEGGCGLPCGVLPLKLQDTSTSSTTATTTETTSTERTTAAAQGDAAASTPPEQPPKGCKDALPGDECFVYVKWAMRTGIHEHPNWYKGITAKSSFYDFQRVLNKEGHGSCPVPCGSKDANQRRSPFRDISGSKDCEDPSSSDQCYETVSWARHNGILEHPEWYDPLNRTSTFQEFQTLLHDEGHGGCSLPCVQPRSQQHETTTTSITSTTATATITTSTSTSTIVTTSTTLKAISTAAATTTGGTGHPGATSSSTGTSTVSSTTSTIPTTTSTSSTSTRTTSSVTATTTSTTTPCVPNRGMSTPSLFCFSVMQVDGPELGLITTQWAARAGIFACNEFAVISKARKNLGKDECGNSVWTWVNDLQAVPMGVSGAATSSYLNTQTFIMAWDTLMNSGKLWKHDFAVKADPDCVFFPERLRGHVKDELGTKAYYLNCKYNGDAKIFGALEVFTTPAMKTYREKSLTCKQMDWQKWGEDLYMQVCMQVLGATPIEDFKLVGDSRCKGAPCSDGALVAYHPYKDVWSYWDCHNKSALASVGQRTWTW